MDLKIPNIVKPIALKEYAEEFGDVVIWAWVNPTRTLRMTWMDFTGETSEADICAWLSEMWSKGPEDTHFTPEDVKAFGDACMERDPRLWGWTLGETVRLMFDHLSAKKKNLITPPSN